MSVKKVVERTIKQFSKQAAAREYQITAHKTAAEIQMKHFEAIKRIQEARTPPRDFRHVEQRSDLDHAVFKTPVEALINMWVAKYGEDWVSKDLVLDDPFFEWAAMRLRSLSKLEEQSFTEEGTRVFMLRIVTGDK